MKALKRILMLLICVVLGLSLCACSASNSGEDKTYTVNKDGTDYIVDTDKLTVSDGKNTYQYEVSGSSNEYSITITFPNGSKYWRDASGVDGVISYTAGWSENYNAERYADGEVLCGILGREVGKERSPLNIILGLILLAAGIFCTASPYNVWYMEYGWRYKDAEPSGLALGLNRFGGIVAIIVAVVLIVAYII